MGEIEGPPDFEGHPVHGTAVKISGAIPMDDLDGLVLGIDDVVQVVSQYKCINVHHDTNSSGELVRIHVLRPVFMVPAPLDPDDPESDFVIRALPRPVRGSVIDDGAAEDE